MLFRSSPASAPAQGRVLLADDFADPTAGYLPLESPREEFVLGYIDHEYRIQKRDPSFDMFANAYLPGAYGNLSIAVDARLIGPSTDGTVALGCRQGPTGGYRADLSPGSFTVALNRLDGSRLVKLSERQSLVIKRGTATNHFELRCAGSEVAVIVNDTLVLSVTDSTYTVGQARIGLAARSTGEARFANLVVTQQ